MSEFWYLQAEILVIFVKRYKHFGQFAPLGENKLQLNFLEIGSQLVIAPSGFGTLCMPGNQQIHSISNQKHDLKHIHTIKVLLVSCFVYIFLQQASKLAHKDSGHVRLG